MTYAGRSFAFSDVIDTSLSQTFSAFSGVIADVSEVSLSLDLGIDVPQAVENGHDLSGAVGTLSLDGTVKMVGRVIRPVYGDPTEAEGVVHFTLREAIIDDSAKVPGPLAKVDEVSWPTHDPDVRGRVYPEVFGAPGAGVCPGSPAYLLDTAAAASQYILIAGHIVEATTVRLTNSSAEWVDDYAVEHITDGRGVTVAVIDALEKANIVTEGDELWVEWSGGNGRSAGAGDVLVHYMSQSTLRLDAGRTGAALQPLNSYILAGYIDERVEPMEWVADNLLELLPFSLARDVDGLYPLVYQHHIRAAEAIAHLTVGPDCVPLSPVTYEGDPITDFRLSYLQRADTGDYLGAAVATEDDNDFCATARSRYRGDAHDGRYSVEMETDIVYDAATADRIVAQHVERNALRARSTQYRLDRTVWGTLVKAGRFITITDPDRSWSSKPAWVTARTDTSSDMSITIIVKDELSRDLR